MASYVEVNPDEKREEGKFSFNMSDPVASLQTTLKANAAAQLCIAICIYLPLALLFYFFTTKQDGKGKCSKQVVYVGYLNFWMYAIGAVVYGLFLSLMFWLIAKIGSGVAAAILGLISVLLVLALTLVVGIWNLYLWELCAACGNLGTLIVVMNWIFCIALGFCALGCLCGCILCIVKCFK